MKLRDMMKRLEELSSMFGKDIEVKIVEETRHWIPDSETSRVSEVVWFPSKVKDSSIVDNGYIAICKRVK